MKEMAPVIAACVAAALAWLIAVLSKEQKTSEFRQAWIDGLREDIADALAARHQYSWLLINLRQLGRSDEQIGAELAKTELPMKLAAKIMRIKLRLNSAEEPHRALDKRLTDPAAMPASHRGEEMIEEIEKIARVDDRLHTIRPDADEGRGCHGCAPADNRKAHEVSSSTELPVS
jgi:hypothetical protein